MCTIAQFCCSLDPNTHTHTAARCNTSGCVPVPLNANCLSLLQDKDKSRLHQIKQVNLK
ncbi:hypothetical protein JOB18_042422 [Solea senegalensis]|uniref:Uncharacterized protein n=1 Tax=Solea senegalensis TaxID=28829 RepID=A0AAV6SWS1_SOLSE|nr:hypothetical protein JOB18_042422 [Solea senegalensis]